MRFTFLPWPPLLDPGMTNEFKLRLLPLAFKEGAVLGGVGSIVMVGGGGGAG